MNLAKQSTAKTFIVGPIIDSAGVAKTDEVVGSIKVTKNGTVGAANGSTTLTHDHTGHYKLACATGDFDTLGEVEFTLNSGTNAMAPVKFQVVPARIYDIHVAGTVYAPVGDVTGNVGIANEGISTAKLGTDMKWLSSAAYSYGQLSAVTSTSVMRLAAGTTQFTADDQPNDKFLLIIWAGQGIGGMAMITDYTVATHEVTLSPALAVLPNTSSYYSVVPIGLARAMGIGGAALASQASVDTIDDLLDTEIAAIKAKTDLIENLYTAQIDFQKDAANTRDEYSVTWLKNGIPQTSGITSPTIQVVKRDATNLIASTAMTNSGSGVLIYNEATNRTTDGESYKVIAVATIDSASRTFTKWIGRDDT